MTLADLHCHILPGLDDGAADVDDAVAMARQAAADGIGVVCATPHVRHDHDVRVAELAERAVVLSADLRERGVPVTIVPGAEVAETILGALDGDELRLCTLGQTGTWVLLEPAPGPLGDSLVAAVRRLAAAHGLHSVIAHPERHVGPGFEAYLHELVAAGALVQATAAHVLDDGAGPVLVDLAARGLVHLVASDAHSARAGRPVALRAALEVLERAGEDVAAFAAAAPAAILRGELVQPPSAGRG